MSTINHACEVLPVVTFPDFPMVHTLGELRVAVIDFEHLAPWFDVFDPRAGDMVRHSAAVLTLIGAFWGERRPKAERWTHRNLPRAKHLIPYLPESKRVAV